MLKRFTTNLPSGSAPTIVSALNRLAGGQDILVALVLLAAVAMMVLPLPHVLVDVFIGISFGTAVLLMMTAVYLQHPLEFSVLPGVIVISTVFRLALSITTTRLILAEGEAGAMIQTFGEFVISGNIAVGLVIFLIITIVQFMVIAKGSERVAEVAARFTLDALPGKQMSIDAEMRNGDLTQQEAREKRGRLERESQLYGAMDGAMKFVKGDAIAGLIIIMINLIGGIAIGTVQRGLPFDEALRLYSLLTVGDALISQIPALLMSITAATIVTRVMGDGRGNLGGDVARQMASDPKALQLAAAVLGGMALIPGAPSAVLVVLALVFGAGGFLRRRRSPPAAEPARGSASKAGGSGTGSPEAKSAQPAEAPAAGSGIVAVLSRALHEAAGPDAVAESIERARAQVSDELGIACPDISVSMDQGLADDRFRIDLENVPILEDRARPGWLALADDPAHLDLAGIPHERPEGEAVWIEAAQADALAKAGIRTRDAAALIGEAVRTVLRKHAASFLGVQETKAFLSRVEQSYGDLVREVTRTTPIQRIADVLRRLLEEGVPIRNSRLVLEAFAEWAEKEHNPVLLTEYVRSALKRQICFPLANANRVISVLVLERAAEDIVRSCLRETSVGTFLVLDEQSSEQLLNQVRRQLAASGEGGGRFAVLCSLDIRRYVRGLLVRNSLDVPVLSYQDLSEEFTVMSVGSIPLGGLTGLAA